MSSKLPSYWSLYRKVKKLERENEHLSKMNDSLFAEICIIREENKNDKKRNSVKSRK